MSGTSVAASAPCSRSMASVAHRVAAGQDRRRPRVGAAGLGLLLLGHRHDPQGEDLVDLGGVEQVAGALRRDRRVVAEHDRRDEHGVGAVVVRDHHRPAPVLHAAAAVGVGPRRGRRAARRSGCRVAEQQVGAHEASTARRGRAPSSRASRPAPSACRCRPGRRTTSRGRPAPSRAATSTVPCSGQRVRTSRPTSRAVLAQLLDVLAAGQVDRQPARLTAGVDRQARQRRSRGHTASWKGIQRLPPTSSSSTAPSRRRCGARTDAGLHLQEAQLHVDGRARARPRRTHLGRHRRLLADPGLGGARAGRACRTASAPGSSATTRGRGRAGSPRRAPRRRPGGPRSGQWSRHRSRRQQVGDGLLPRRRPRAARWRARASMVSRSSRIQPLPGK